MQLRPRVVSHVEKRDDKAKGSERDNQPDIALSAVSNIDPVGIIRAVTDIEMITLAESEEQGTGDQPDRLRAKHGVRGGKGNGRPLKKCSFPHDRFGWNDSELRR